MIVPYLAAGLLFLTLALHGQGASAEASPSTAGSGLALVPWPKSLARRPGTLELAAEARIFGHEGCRTQAEGLSDALLMAYGQRLRTSYRRAIAGDIVLQLSPDLAKGGYRIVVKDSVLVQARDGQALHWAVATLLQLMEPTASGWKVPKVTIEDRPDEGYRCLMVDLAAQPHRKSTVEQIIALCHLYKVPYLQLRLTGQASCVFPSELFPKLGVGEHALKADELAGLVEFARDRGVTLVPEIDLLGDAEGLVRAQPELFGLKDWKKNRGRLNIGREATCQALEQILGEVMDVFDSSPYVHLGGMNVVLAGVEEDPVCQRAMKRLGAKTARELQHHFMVRMIQRVTERGKTPLLWPGFDHRVLPKVPHHAIVMAKERPAYTLPNPQGTEGYRLINASWKPLWVTSQQRSTVEHIYGWHTKRWDYREPRQAHLGPLELATTAPVYGFQFTSWNLRDAEELPGLRRRLSAFSERTWHARAVKPTVSFDAFAKRLEKTDEWLQRLLVPAKVELVAEAGRTPRSVTLGYETSFGRTIKIRAAPFVKGRELRFTLNDTPVSKDSPLFGGERVFGRDTKLTMRVFDSGSQHPVGYEWSHLLRVNPIVVEFLGEEPLEGPDFEGKDLRFNGPVTLRARTQKKDLRLRVWIDGQLTGASAAEREISIAESQSVRIEAVEPDGTSTQHQWSKRLAIVKSQRHRALGQPVATSSGAGTDADSGKPVDGKIELQGYWPADTPSAWWQVDLGEVKNIDRVRMICYWRGEHVPRYTLHGSIDGQRFEPLVDATQNDQPSQQKGRLHSFERRAMRFLRVVPAQGDRFKPLHIVEVQVFADGDGAGRVAGSSEVPVNTVSGGYFHSRPPENRFPNRQHTFLLTSNTTFGWKTQRVAGDIQLNGHQLTVDTGGGNRTTLGGKISGKGSLLWLGGHGPMTQSPGRLLGEEANSYQGTTRVPHGLLSLGKPTGVTAIPGDIALGGGRGDALLKLEQSHQIADEARLRVLGKHRVWLLVEGYKEQLGTLTLEADFEIDLHPDRASKLRFANCSNVAWDLTRQIVIRGWNIKEDEVSFGTDSKGLTKEQLARVAFLNPRGLPSGLYRARIGQRGLLEPSTVIPLRPPAAYALSEEAIAARRKVFEIPDAQAYSHEGPRLERPIRVSLFGDSILWSGGILDRIRSGVRRKLPKSAEQITLLQRGINGATAKDLAKGTSRKDLSRSKQASFLTTLKADQPDIVVIYIGINDASKDNHELKGVPLFTAYVKQMVGDAQRIGCRVILVTPGVEEERPDGTNRRDAVVDAYATAVREVAKKSAVPVVDLRTIFLAYLRNHNREQRLDGTLRFRKSGILTKNGVHPSALGQELIARHLWAAISQQIAQLR